jgi:hypothetical protein
MLTLFEEADQKDVINGIMILHVLNQTCEYDFAPLTLPYIVTKSGRN